MDITCPRCHCRHHVDPPSPTRFRTRPLRFRCSECGHAFPLHGEGAPLPPGVLPIEPPSRLVPEPRTVPVGEPMEMLRVGGDVYSLPDAATLQRWILEQRVSRSDTVSLHGMRWTALGDRAEFAIFFTAADGLSHASPGPTPEPLPSPLAPMRHQLPMADDEEIYIEDLGPIDGGNGPTEFVATPPPSELSPFPPTDEPPIGLGPRPPHSGPLDELPIGNLLPPRRPIAADEPESLLDLPVQPSFQSEAHSLGFRLGPDPDTMEATMEATRVSASPELIASDPTEEFMRTGDFGELELDLAPPPVVFPGGQVRVTVATATGRSVLDDDHADPGPASNTRMFVAAGTAGIVLLAMLLWYSLPHDDATTAIADAAPTTAKPAAGATTPKPVAPPTDPATQPTVAGGPNVVPEPAPPTAPAPAPGPVAKPKPAPVTKAAPPPPEKPVPRETPTPKAAVAPIPSGGSARSLADQGWKAMDRGDIEGAHGLFAKALQKDPNAGWALYGRGYANEKLGDKVSARVDYCSAWAGARADAELSRELEGGLRRLNAGC